MNKNQILSETWLKASVIGTVWASSEIVLGSFLHNLRVPFSGSILTAIGVVLLISASYIWRDRGLYWRAGLICALMKTMSPSAVIFGPMIAIFSEAVLFEVSIRVFGRTVFGFVIASILAVSWTFFQKIINFLIFYGFNIVELYKSIMKYTEKQLNLQFDTLIIPILLLFSVYIVVGIGSAYIGIKTGKQIINNKLIYNNISNTNSYNFVQKKDAISYEYSLKWLIINIIFMLAGILSISLTDWTIWIPAVILISCIWILKYKRALRQISRPKFWIFFVVITMLTAFLFTKLQSKTLMEAFFIGIEMNLRATVLILGFSVLGTELYNPKIRLFFSKTSFRQLPVALELASESLPMVISAIPDVKTILRNPISVVSQLVLYSDFRFSRLMKSQNFIQKIFIITGSMDAGKTKFVKNLVKIFHEKQIEISGIYAEKMFENSDRIGYNLVEIATGISMPFLRKSDDLNEQKIGPFAIYQEAINFGNICMTELTMSDNQLVIIDEIGNLELSGGGWATALEHLLQAKNQHILITVRTKFVEKVMEKWKIHSAKIFDISERSNLDIEIEISESIS